MRRASSRPSITSMGCPSARSAAARNSAPVPREAEGVGADRAHAPRGQPAQALAEAGKARERPLRRLLGDVPRGIESRREADHLPQSVHDLKVAGDDAGNLHVEAVRAEIDRGHQLRQRLVPGRGSVGRGRRFSHGFAEFGVGRTRRAILCRPEAGSHAARDPIHVPRTPGAAARQVRLDARRAGLRAPPRAARAPGNQAHRPPPARAGAAAGPRGQLAAERARQTTERVCRFAGMVGPRIEWEPAIYEAELETLLEVLSLVPERMARVMSVRTQPGIRRTGAPPRRAHPGGVGRCQPHADRGLAHLEMPDAWTVLPRGAARCVSLVRPRDLD